MTDINKLMKSLRAAVNRATAKKNTLFRYVMECNDDGTGDCPPQSVGACCCLDQVTGTVSCNDIMYTPPEPDPNNPPPNPCGNDSCTFYVGKSCNENPCVLILMPAPLSSENQEPVEKMPMEQQQEPMDEMGM